MKLINEKAAAAYLGCSVYKLQKDRSKGSGVSYVKVGRCVRYDTEQLSQYLEKQTFTSTSEYGGE